MNVLLVVSSYPLINYPILTSNWECIYINILSHSVENIPSVKQRGVKRGMERMIMPKAPMEQLGMNQIVPVRGMHYRAVTSPNLEEGAA